MQILILFVLDNYRDWTAAYRAKTHHSHLGALRRPVTPMNPIWQASIDGTLDPRNFPDPPYMIDVVSCLVKDPGPLLRPAAFQRLTRDLVEQRQAAKYCFFVLRARTDQFLIACRDAGISSPALLPLDPAQATGPVRRLLDLRRDLDETITLCRDAFPERIRAGMQNGSASDVVAT
jgi:hypothetical protein